MSSRHNGANAVNLMVYRSSLRFFVFRLYYLSEHFPGNVSQ